ncbi:MAG: 50S ribosomal protein L21 [Candidatus Yanofskybacteria bacterium RIFCSPHIGHO2_01_FULL_45_42]|uniref:Large ribosomal subunit protein bL21 n=3 Tax=Candidatus Yanofskyibacteriota TaxID=1752733 RepID=A0A1F8H5A4_9BACT|nr:MAG: 50S ribosomal protein L21 [Candidatus Yanofskybacteria bacterium RIFCSPHIGHO2_01_FULL_45_42]OGN16040.1 MAG: 50S ribosomal protein L21 [Candidatus Yanofskybacteria bacterium RIFCSPHIGHO2_02_FULL_46_19]OGN26165.1 MAG: 50S ribosomal protein L21 [Candidatus Yanofskybacteria bacterium RIFCSPLOWO2_01_FULL_45_72]OGN32136.1 MAG: 50S ribosomal protein L21 [Candidatus Yanofskybacteria bacterium RIFCSPLOWO2_02_FULL_45_18]
MSKFAIIRTGGKQYKVAEGDILSIEKLAHDGQTVEFNKVLLTGEDDKATIGKPLVIGANVQAKVLEDGKGEKKIVFRYKAKVRRRKKKGHRQPYTKVEITKITP